MHNELYGEWRSKRLFRRIIKSFRLTHPLHNLSATSLEWTSFTQLIQELAGGNVRRNRFTQWELDFLLDVQTARLRKSARADILRRSRTPRLFGVSGGDATSKSGGRRRFRVAVDEWAILKVNNY
jgi:hypothetical protein